jgi:hypothetical protein
VDMSRSGLDRRKLAGLAKKEKLSICEKSTL